MGKDGSAAKLDGEDGIYRVESIPPPDGEPNDKETAVGDLMLAFAEARRAAALKGLDSTATSKVQPFDLASALITARLPSEVDATAPASGTRVKSDAPPADTSYATAPAASSEVVERVSVVALPPLASSTEAAPAPVPDTERAVVPAAATTPRFSLLGFALDFVVVIVFALAIAVLVQR